MFVKQDNIDAGEFIAIFLGLLVYRCRWNGKVVEFLELAAMGYISSIFQDLQFILQVF